MSDRPDEETRKKKITEYEVSLTLAREKYEDAFEKDECPMMNVNEFECFAILGKGAWGLVVKAKKAMDFYAIKVVQKEAMRAAKFQRKVVREKRRQYAMSNEFVTKLFGKYKDAEYLYMIFEWALFGDLKHFLKCCETKAVSESRSREIVCQVALGLEYVHACQVMVRDLKPDNILMFDGGRVKVADLGLACVNYKHPIKPFGTKGYMPPEMLYGGKCSDVVDWWALGVVIYQTLRGCDKHPYFFLEGKNELARIRENEYDFKDPEWNDISEDCKNLINGLLHRDPDGRIGGKDAGGGNWKEHAWFAKVDWYKVIYETEQFDVDPVKFKGYYEEGCDKHLFDQVGPHIEDPIADELDLF